MPFINFHFLLNQEEKKRVQLISIAIKAIRNKAKPTKENKVKREKEKIRTRPIQIHSVYFS